jgi:hypothetical protein
MRSEAAPPREKSNMGTSQAIAGEEVEDADRKAGGSGGEHDEIKHGIAFGRIGRKSSPWTPSQLTVLEKRLRTYKSERELIAAL